MDVEVFKKNVDRFLEYQRKSQKRIENELTLEQLIKQNRKLPESVVDVFFEKEHAELLDASLVDEISDALHTMRETVNDFSPQKRFFILETMNFFSSQISIGKLIPALLVLSGDDQKKVIWEFIKPTFLSINNNVEILVSTDNIFDSGNVHIERGNLYLFVSDIAKIIIKIFKKAFLKKFPNARSSIELLLNIIKWEASIQKTEDGKIILKTITDDSDILRTIILEFVETIQSHEAIYDYSLKRHSYYKHVLKGLLKANRFKGVPQYEVSKVIAGCLLGNRQLRPDEVLIDAMISEESFLSTTTQDARDRFYDELAPSTIYTLLNQVFLQVQKLSKVKLGKEYEFVQKLNVRSILRRIWTSLVAVIEKGVHSTVEAWTVISGQIVKTVKALKLEGGKTAKSARSSNSDGPSIIPKYSGAVNILKNHFENVKPSVISFRGEFEGASQKDYGYNARIFKQDENLMIDFRHAFEKIFQVMKNNSYFREVSYKNQRKITEFSTNYVFGEYLFCFGVTHIKHSGSTLIQEKDLFPYAILFQEAEEKEFGRVLSREATLDDINRVYNEAPLTVDLTLYYYEALFYVLHLLPEKMWIQPDCQACVQFLLREMHAFKEKGKALMFTKDLPTLES